MRILVDMIAILSELALFYLLSSRMLTRMAEPRIMIGVHIGALIGLTFVHSLDNSSQNTLVLLIYCFGYAALMFAGRSVRKAIVVLVFMSVNFLADRLSITILHLLFNVSISILYYDFNSYLLAVLFGKSIGILLISLILTISQQSKKPYYQPSNHHRMLTLLINFSTLVIFLGIFYIHRNYGISNASVLVIMILFLISLYTYYDNEKNIDRIGKQNERTNLEEKAQVDHHYDQLIEQNTESARMIHHDFKKHMNMIKYHLDHGEIDQAKKYVGELSDYIDNQIYWSTSIKTLDIILNLHQEKIRNAGIKLVYDVAEVDLDRIRVMDQNVLFSNLLDNCIVGTTGTDEPYIHIKIKPWHTEKTVIIKFANTTRKKTTENSLSKPSQHEVHNHGYGLKIVKSVVDRYDGTFTIEYVPEYQLMEATIIFDYT